MAAGSARPRNSSRCPTVPLTAPANQLLGALLASATKEGLPADEGTLRALMREVELAAGDVVHEPGDVVEQVYFPLTAVIGLMTVTAGAPEVEGMAVGQEGLVGLAAVLGDGTSPHRAVVQVPGRAVRLPAAALRGLFDLEPTCRRLLGQYTQTMIVLLSQRVACSQRHTAQQRCADWLLRHADRVGTEPIPVTQQFLAAMLGLRRTTVSAIAAHLQASGLITYRYGRVVVRDHSGLERLACACYRVFRDQMRRLTTTATTPPDPPLPT